MSQTVIVERLTGHPSIATLTFNRPEVYNAMSDELIHAFRDATAALSSANDIRALIVRGAGKAFLAGGDVASFYARKDDPTLAATVTPLGGALHEGIIAIRNMPFPVIASIQGACAGAGVSVALACDFAIASDKASFNTAYAKIGLSPDGGATFFLARIVGIRRATELLMLTDNIDAETACALGLVNRVVGHDTLDAEVAALATRLASGATLAFANVKKLLNQSLESPLKAQLDAEIGYFAKSSQTADFKEGVTAFVEKRLPSFTGN
jgi:2-(1,2-epoxy-1,2-dihydrophenyl)acetyl-CoA isomerase